MAIDTSSDALFEKIVKYGMKPNYVAPLLALSQRDFFTLTAGIERAYQRQITRKELAEVAGFSSAAIYSYTASPSARDYRTISEDMRIAAIWRVSCALPRLPETKRGPREKYVIDGKPTTLSAAAKLLGYSKGSNLLRAIKGEGIPRGGDISHVKIKPTKYYIVDGQQLELAPAAFALGYRSSTAIRKKNQS
ncbi:hypothetical protein ACSD30_000744 [Escherichia coli]|nr:hypothetical protein [Escherichia coli]EJG8081931.1 hypothetical protein [Escherichia coli]ELO1960223.1 hypothetical protein [Escherichia coli]ELO3079128.1 hypothetical protein [Escherichia coli]ELO3209616.1 hypothetical protein [Escherichia coli]